MRIKNISDARLAWHETGHVLWNLDNMELNSMKVEIRPVPDSRYFGYTHPYPDNPPIELAPEYWAAGMALEQIYCEDNNEVYDITLQEEYPKTLWALYEIAHKDGEITYTGPNTNEDIHEFLEIHFATQFYEVMDRLKTRYRNDPRIPVMVSALLNLKTMELPMIRTVLQ